MLKLVFEKLDHSDIRNYLHECQDVFKSMNDREFLNTYSAKLASKANFICGRTPQDTIGCLIAFYTNKPKIFITLAHTIVYFRRKGYLKKMLERIIDKYAGLGFNEIELEVYKNNYNAIKAYSQLGFGISCEKQFKYRMTLKI